MNTNIYPCFWFHNNGAEAAKFYAATFPKAIVESDSGVVQMLNINNQKIMLLNGGPVFTANPSVSMMVLCDTEQEVKDYYNKLSLEGKIMMALDKYDWSPCYAWVQDKFGISWQLYFNHRQATNQKYVPTLMFTGPQAGKAAEAIETYTTIFPGSFVQGILKYPEGSGADAGLVQHAQFNIHHYTLMCMDSSFDHGYSFSEGASMVVICNSQEEVDYYWNSFVDNGGQESKCGWLKDKFGFSWQIVPQRLLDLIGQADKTKANNAMQAMLKMSKIEIDKLEATNQ